MNELVQYGFVYLWFDKKTKKYYIGSHWGNPNDGYICSSKSMREAYKRRPQDFKRRILKRIYTNRHDLLNEEQRWLDMIKPREFGFQYYNINARANNYAWWMNEETKQQVITKMKQSLKGRTSSWKGRSPSPESREKMRLAKLGKKASEETKRKMRESSQHHRKGAKHTDEAIQRMKQSINRAYENGYVNHFKGKCHTEESIQKMKESIRKRNEMI